jgi:lipoprotein-anchoring transpeptidase ErfK/SrfK
MSVQQQPYQQQRAPQSPPPKPGSNRQPSPFLIISGLTALGLTVLLVIVGVVAIIYLSGGDSIESGVTVANVSVSGLSAQEAQQTLETQLGNPAITVTDGDRTWQISAADLGAYIDYPYTVELAANAPANSIIEPYYTIDLLRTQEAFIGLSGLVNIAAVPGNSPKNGRAIDIPVMLDRLRVDVSGELADGVLNLTMIDVAPPETITTSNYTGKTTVHVVEQGQELGLIAQLYGVSLDSIVQFNDLDNPNLLFVGQELTIPAGGVYYPSAEDAPPAPLATGKSIVVSTRSQRIYAYENGQLVHSHLTSTGLPDTPTVLGDYNIYVKYRATDMRGADYFLPQVPFTMYFYQGYGIHGTYWHNSFGRPMSHGCVNLPVEEAEWFFNFAEVGTLVRVI